MNLNLPAKVVSDLKAPPSCEDQTFDFKVTVENKTFACHRFILAAWSPFFKGMFCSGMKETVSASANIQGLTSKTFEDILNIMYAVENVVNNNNVLDIWLAADMLLMDALVNVCKKYALKNIDPDTLDDFFWFGRNYDEELYSEVIDFITYHFDECNQHDCMMELSNNEFLSLIKNPELITIQEENVINTVLKWVSYTPEVPFNNQLLSSGKIKQDSHPVRPSQRLSMLSKLISVCRLTSACSIYLDKICHHSLIIKDTVSLNIVYLAKKFDSYSYIFHNYLPTFAVHREFSMTRDVALLSCLNGRTLAFDFCTKTWLNEREFQSFNYSEYMNFRHLITNGETIYLSFISDEHPSFKVLKLKNDDWETISTLQNLQNFQPDDLDTCKKFLTIKKSHFFIFIFVRTGEMYICDITKINSFRKVTTVNTTCNITYAMDYGPYILVFCDDVETSSVSVLVFDTFKKSWISCVPNGFKKAQGMTSFTMMNKTYILMSSGELFCIGYKCNQLAFSSLGLLENFDFSMVGSVVYGNDLFLFGSGHSNVPNLPELFDNIFTENVGANCTSLIFLSLTKNNPIMNSKFLR